MAMGIEEIKSLTAMLGITYGTALDVANKEPSPETAPVVIGEPNERKVFIFNSSVVEQIFNGEISCYRKNPKLVANFIKFIHRLIATGEQFQCRGGLWMLFHVLYGRKYEFTTDEFCALKITLTLGSATTVCPLSSSRANIIS
jgi:hypothetical protein